MKPYSVRNRIPGQLVYESFPEKSKNQIVYIWDKFFNSKNEILEDSSDAFFGHVEERIKEFHGIKDIEIAAHPGMYSRSSKRVAHYFEALKDIEKELDVIEFVFNIIDRRSRVYGHPVGIYRPKNAAQDFNDRLSENNIGYRIQDGKIIRIDKELLHEIITNQTFILLSNPLFKNANDEFMSAHQHYRHKRYKECLSNCSNSFESTMKIICTNKGWDYNEKKDTAKTLIKICIAKELIPSYLTSSLTGIRTTLESSIPTIRNRNSGHGQGVTKNEVSKELAAYMLYLTGSTINFLVESGGYDQ